MSRFMLDMRALHVLVPLEKKYDRELQELRMVLSYRACCGPRAFQ